MSEYIVPIVCCWGCFFAGMVARQFSLKPLKKEIDRLFDGWNQSNAECDELREQYDERLTDAKVLLERVQELEVERDELKIELDDWKEGYERICRDGPRHDEKHCSCAVDLWRRVQELEQERDKWKKSYRKIVNVLRAVENRSDGYWAENSELRGIIYELSDCMKKNLDRESFDPETMYAIRKSDYEAEMAIFRKNTTSKPMN